MYVGKQQMHINWTSNFFFFFFLRKITGKILPLVKYGRESELEGYHIAEKEVEFTLTQNLIEFL